MLNKLSKGIVDWQIQRKYLSNEERELYVYAYEVLINQVINIIAAILIAVLMHALIPVLVFLVCYIPLRSYCGGYHAKTNIGCTCISALVIYFMCLLEKTIAVKIENFWLIIGFFVAGLIKNKKSMKQIKASCFFYAQPHAPLQRCMSREENLFDYTLIDTSLSASAVHE